KQIHDCAVRALELARKHPKDGVAVEALYWIIDGGLGYNAAGAEIESSLELLQRDHIASDKLERVCAIAYVYDSVSTKPERLLRDVDKKNPNRNVRGRACYSLGTILCDHASEVKSWREIRDTSKAKMWEANVNPEVMNRIKTGDADKLLQEAEGFYERTIAEYGEVQTSGGRTLGDIAKTALFEMHHLIIGKTAPEIEGEDI